MGVFHAKGWWPKSSCPPSKVCLPWFLKRGIWDVPGILPGCPGPLGGFKKFVQKKFVCIFRSLIIRYQHSSCRIGISISSLFSGSDSISLRSMPLKPHEWPLKLQNAGSGPLRLRASGVRTLKARSLRGFPRQKIKDMPSVKSFPIHRL